MTGDVRKPEKVSPPSTAVLRDCSERRASSGCVILQTIINEQGQVDNVKVLKGLPMRSHRSRGSRSQVQWKFSPATLNGKPVAVYFNLTVNFQLQ